MISKGLHGKESSHIPITDLSDHLPCVISLIGSFLAKKEPPKITTSKLSDQNIEEKKNVLVHHDWTEELAEKMSMIPLITGMMHYSKQLMRYVQSKQKH